MEEKNSWIATVLTSGNAIPLVLLIIALVVILAVFAKKGIVAFNGHGLQVGNDGNERKIIRQQLEYVRAELELFVQQLVFDYKDVEGWDLNKCMYAKELVYDVYMEIIVFNHITNDDFYIKGKYIRVLSEISKVNLPDNFKTDDFNERIFKETDKIIKSLVDIKKYYSKR